MTLGEETGHRLILRLALRNKATVCQLPRDDDFAWKMCALDSKCKCSLLHKAIHVATSAKYWRYCWAIKSGYLRPQFVNQTY